VVVIYEVIRVISGKCLFLEDHLERLFNSLKLAEKKSAKTPEDITRMIYSLVYSKSLQNGNIRLEICFGPSGENILAQIIPHKYPDPQDYSTGVKAISFETERKNPNAKILNPSLREKINNLLSLSGAYEAVLVNQSGFVTEGSRSNLFFINAETIYTSPSSTVLVGITREQLIKLCKENDINVSERNIKFSEITDFDSAFITGTSPKILPLNSIDSIKFNANNKLLQDLIIAYNDRINKYIVTAKI